MCAVFLFTSVSILCLKSSLGNITMPFIHTLFITIISLHNSLYCLILTIFWLCDHPRASNTSIQLMFAVSEVLVFSLLSICSLNTWPVIKITSSHINWLYTLVTEYLIGETANPVKCSSHFTLSLFPALKVSGGKYEVMQIALTLNF